MSTMRRLSCTGLLWSALLLGLLTRIQAAPVDAATLDYSVLRSIPIQNQGRIKPLDTFARETVFSITGKERFEGREPMEVILTWIADPESARKAPVIDVSHHLVHDPLGLARDLRRATVAELVDNAHLRDLARAVMQKQQSNEDLSNADKQVLRLMGRLEMLNSLLSAEAFTVVPNETDANGAWSALSTLVRAGANRKGGAQVLAEFDQIVAAFRDKDAIRFAEGARHFKSDLVAMGPTPIAMMASIDRELQYNDLHPFGKAWVIYLAALLVVVAAPALKGRSSGSGAVYWLGYAMAAGGLILHIYGFLLRCSIAGRPPVTNMYESVIWVSFGAMLISLVLEGMYRTRTILMAASTAVIVCLILADNTPAVLDPAINPLTPVLRSNFWLTIHVLTITMSYAAFMVAMGQGHVALWSYAFHSENRTLQRSLHSQLYRAIQVGVLLLAAGTILGGVWANYSWGRFWGWDPKEVWALIALLGYLALLHGRFAGWLKDFGLAVGSVVAFLGVLMAWYGVNFVLGAGLHAYGFGEGGQQYVGMAIVADMAFVGAMVLIHRRRAEESV